MNKRTIQAEMSSYVGKLLRDNFGKGPSSVYVSIKEPFITMHLREFLSPMERVLMAQNKDVKVEEIRDLLMNELLPEIKATLYATHNLKVSELYYDWSLHNRSGIIIGVMENTDQTAYMLEDYPNKAAIHREIEQVSKQAERLPDTVNSCYLNDRTLIVKREGILVRIEKELIRGGFIEPLKLTKRHLEKSLLETGDFNDMLNAEIMDIFVDWDFIEDISYIVFILKPTQNQGSNDSDN
ncbi:Na-translocating system protein MpsC family protein [Alkalihalobacillus sp. FSL R5-0424]